MPSIHETIESDESFSSLSDAEQEEGQDHDQQPSHSTATVSPTVRRPKNHHREKDKEEAQQGGSRGSPRDSSNPREPRALVEYSDVSSEEFSEPEAGEITDSPSQSPVISPRYGRQRPRSPTRSARPSPRHSLPQLPTVPA
ncbi:uncharacterized protein LOC119574304 [Penaeus monodon]|uniref:uncharacterized protein LOC119574304 n=1 Tax=Penaeus monodon TaxID=6687 RepID=UPI0018A76506|nr:uncharacterized protein LOC119574304 [Penaeus monodon]